MKTFRNTSLVLASIATLVLLSGCSRYDYKTSPIHAALVITYDESGTVPEAYYEIRDEDLLEEFESFFPGYREFKQFDDREDWTTQYRIYMCLYAGRTLKIVSNGQKWGITFGGAPVNGDLGAFLEKIPKNLAATANAD